MSLSVTLERDASTEGLEEGAGIGAVHAPLFPRPKAEGWWLVVGEPKANAILALKRVTLAQRANVRLAFPAPAEPGSHAVSLLLICDSYAGCDQEYGFDLAVGGDGGGAVAMTDERL